MEEAALNLERLGDGRALLVTQPLGEAPSVATFDKIDRAWNKTQRSNSPLTGAYSCCRMNHVVVSKDGAKQNRVRQGRAQGCPPHFIRPQGRRDPRGVQGGGKL